MSQKDNILFAETLKLPICHKNVFVEERSLKTIISDNGETMQIKLKDASAYYFNFTEKIDKRDFEIIRTNQCLDINYTEFKANIIEMLHQFLKGDMFLKCELVDKKCTLTFYTKSKIKNIVYLALELHITDQNEIISEMYIEMSEVQDINIQLQKQLSITKTQIQQKDTEVQNLELVRNRIVSQFSKDLYQIDELFSSKLHNVQHQVFSKLSLLQNQMVDLHSKINIIKKENKLRNNSRNQIIEKVQRLQKENDENHETIQNIKKENLSLNILRVNLERSIADLKRNLEENRGINNKLELKNYELEQDLKKLSIIVTQKECKISELSKDLVQANNMLVGFNQHYDSKSQQVEELQQLLTAKEKLLQEEQLRANHILTSFENYKANYNKEKFEEITRNLMLSKRKNEEYQEDIRKLNKINALLSQRVSQGIVG